MMMKRIISVIVLAALPLFASAQKKGNECVLPVPGTETRSADAGWKNNADWMAVAKDITATLEGKSLDLLLLGDSITQGYGSDGLSYPEVLEQLTDIPVRNFGEGGEDSGEILARSLAYGPQKEDILVIQMGDNGGWDELDELIGQYRRLIDAAGTNRYIIITSTDDPDDFEQIWGYTNDPIGLEDTWYEAEFKAAFGDHLLIGRKYLIEHGLEINGLEETEEDRERTVKGNISLQLRNPEIDNTHLNEAGYIALAQGVYEKGKELGYW
jgi:lysophospholipase L1-like esterase